VITNFKKSSIVVLGFLIFCTGCSGGFPGAATQKDAETNSTQQTPPQSSNADIEALKNAGVPLPEPGDVTSLDDREVQLASALAAGQTGERAPFSDFHTNVSPLLPAKEQTSLALIPVAAECEAVDTNGNAFDDCAGNPEVSPSPSPSPTPGQCPEKVCATACASASATAAAAAFAHASARACAFAYAWACVFERMAPFNRVCAWSRSEACASSFASAFGFGFATAQDQECKTVCSDGTSTTTKSP